MYRISNVAIFYSIYIFVKRKIDFFLWLRRLEQHYLALVLVKEFAIFRTKNWTIFVYVYVYAVYIKYARIVHHKNDQFINGIQSHQSIELLIKSVTFYGTVAIQEKQQPHTWTCGKIIMHAVRFFIFIHFLVTA